MASDKKSSRLDSELRLVQVICQFAEKLHKSLSPVTANHSGLVIEGLINVINVEILGCHTYILLVSAFLYFTAFWSLDVVL